MNNITTSNLYAELISRTKGITEGKLEGKHVGFVGCGASINLIESCARTGVTEFSLWDMDSVELPNIGRTAFNYDDIGMSKVQASAKHIANINPLAIVHTFDGDFLKYDEADVIKWFAKCDVIVMGTDAQTVQLRGNAIGKRLNKAMLFPGFYKKGDGGEIVVVTSETPCYRCQVISRFEDNPNEQQVNEADDLKAESGLIFDCDHLDSIVGKIVVAMLLKDDIAEFKKIYEHVSKHSLIFSKHSPDFKLEGEDIFGDIFGSSPLTFAYQTLWLDPSGWRDENCFVCGDKV